MKYLLTPLLLLINCTTPTETTLPVYTVSAEPEFQLDPRLFGGFFEKATWNGEIGSDAAISRQTGELLPEVVEYVQWMNVPTLRYPGGTAIDYYPWYYLIDRYPRTGQTRRPPNRHWREPGKTKDVVTSDGRMGLHEFIDFCRAVGTEPLLVANLGDAFYEKRDIETAARELGAEWVRYCNDVEGEWADLRAANGHHQPFNVKYFQIGNETWLFDGYAPDERTGEAAERYADATEAYARAMRAADPSIELIIDGMEGLSKNVDPALVDYQTFHAYAPWGIGEYRRDDAAVPVDSLNKNEVWNALVAAPSIDPETGFSQIVDATLDSVMGPLAVTEWNFNTWFMGDAKQLRPDNQLLAYGIGAAGFLHGLMRRGDRIKIANQSMLVGTGWNITSIRVDTTETERPVFYPSGLLTGLYSREHGTNFHALNVQNAHSYENSLQLNGMGPHPKVAEQDVIVTSDAEHYYAHIINRSFDQERELVFQFPDPVDRDVEMFTISDHVESSRSRGAALDTIQYRFVEPHPHVYVLPRSVSVIRFDRK